MLLGTAKFPLRNGVLFQFTVLPITCESVLFFTFLSSWGHFFFWLVAVAVNRQKRKSFKFYLHSSLRLKKFNVFLLEKAMAPHSSTRAWKIPWMEEPGGLQSMRSLRVGHDWATSLSLSCIGEGNGNPLQCSCLENPRDGRAWWAAVCGVAQSQTRLKWLKSSSMYVFFVMCYTGRYSFIWRMRMSK